MALSNLRVKATAKEENDRKKAYLNTYLPHVRRIQRINEEIAEVRSMRTSMQMNCDGMPHGSRQSDLSEYEAKLDEMERNLIRERRERYKAYKDIAGRIKKLRSENEGDVLFYRYIKGLDWWEIAEKMQYSERWIYKIHGRALIHLEIPKEFSEVQ